MGRADSAYANMVAHRTNCAQNVLLAFCEELGLERNMALKVALGFGGGMGGTGKTCGAVTGAYMVIGLKLNPTLENTAEIRDKSRQLIKEFNRCFVEKHGSLICRDLLGYDINTPEGLQAIREQDLSAKVCPRLVRGAVEIVEDIIVP
jgi:C_GCAxxG_C_C family probable redox protein